MLSFLFPYTEPLKVGDYLMGSPKWTEAVSLRNARVICLGGGGASGTGHTCLLPTVLQLEVDGELIDKTIPVLPLMPGERINSVVVLNRVLPPGSELRIKCVRAPVAVPPGYEDCIREVGVNVEATVASTWEPLTPSGGSDLYVMWVNGQEEMRLFEYSTSNQQFTESSPGISNGRASIVNGPDCEIQIQGEAALQIGSDQVLRCGAFTASGSTTCHGASSTGQGTSSSEGGGATGQPRLEFWRGWQRLASLTKSGQLVTVDLSEVTSLAGGSGSVTGLGFTFLGNGAPAAVIGPVKITALGLKEGWISPFDRLTSDGSVRVTDDGARRVIIGEES